jgi:electron transfer flavoprotein beta subunit
MRAKQKPVAATTPDRPQARLRLVRLAVPAGQGKQAEVLGRGPEAAPAVVEVLRGIGVVA